MTVTVPGTRRRKNMTHVLFMCVQLCHPSFTHPSPIMETLAVMHTPKPQMASRNRGHKTGASSSVAVSSRS